MIDRNTAPLGEEYLEYNRRRWGGDGWTADLRRAGRPDGALFADWRWWPNTLLAHRLASLAHTHGKGHQAAELLFQLTYERGQNISSQQVLREAAAELGLPANEAEQALQGNAWLDQVLREDRRAKEELGISGVPYFVISGEGSGVCSALSGAQSVRALRAVLANAAGS